MSATCLSHIIRPASPLRGASEERVNAFAVKPHLTLLHSNSRRHFLSKNAFVHLVRARKIYATITRAILAGRSPKCPSQDTATAKRSRSPSKTHRPARIPCQVSIATAQHANVNQGLQAPTSSSPTRIKSRSTIRTGTRRRGRTP